MRQWDLFWSNADEIAQQLVAQLPWGHNLAIIAKVKDTQSATFYVRKAIENNWSRAVLPHHIESGLVQREGRAITNFEITRQAVQSDLAHQLLKDPWQFAFLMFRWPKQPLRWTVGLSHSFWNRAQHRSSNSSQ